jgi:hypothetical protein
MGINVSHSIIGWSCCRLWNMSFVWLVAFVTTVIFSCYLSFDRDLCLVFGRRGRIYTPIWVHLSADTPRMHVNSPRIISYDGTS